LYRYSVSRVKGQGSGVLLQDLDRGQTVDVAVQRFGFTFAEFERDPPSASARACRRDNPPLPRREASGRQGTRQTARSDEYAQSITSIPI
jgi:hypothetical protein